jgi:T-complex protein 1 subunit beta
MAEAITREAAKTPGKESHAMESFAAALRQLPSIIAENGGYDSAQLVSELRALHAVDKKTMGLNMYKGEVGDMVELGITESFSVKRQVLIQAAEAAEMILRVDDILKAAPRKREQDRSHC